ncbi:MAG: outer membrane protein assembly factor BamE [Caldimonas sp.]
MPMKLPSPLSGCLPIVFAAVTLGGCQSLQSSDSFLGVITPYKVEVVQGNVVTSEQAALIKPGLNRAQVRDVLGSPLLTDPFHGDRWDYVFTIRRQGAPAQVHRVVAFFKSDVLTSVDTGGTLPSEREFVASIDTFKTPRDAPPLALSEEQIKALPAPVRPPPPDPVPPAPTRTYPALEPTS